VQNIGRFEILTFDCYGTLIDWETGILQALRRLTQRHACEVSDTHILELYAKLEAAAESGPFKPYREVLRLVTDGFASEYGFTPTEEERLSLEHSIAAWQPFPDTVTALAALASRFRLGVLSNIDNDLFVATAARLRVPLDLVVTAEQVGAYKPALEFFRHASKRMAVPLDRWLHVAQSLYHDIAPARELGIATVWVNRRHDRPGFGATVPSAARPDAQVPDLVTLCTRLGSPVGP